MDVIFLQLDPVSETLYPLEREKPTTPIDEQAIHFSHVFKTKESLFWAIEILGCAFELVGDELYRTTCERALRIYKIILYVVNNFVKSNGKKNTIDLNGQIYPVDIHFEEVF